MNTKLGLLLFLLGWSTGCTTVKNYEMKAAPGPVKAADYPIYVYPEQIRVPRPHEVIGAMSIHDTPFTIFGGSFESELEDLKKQARQVGADAVRLTSVQQPDFLHSKYRVEANLIRFTEAWEKAAWREDDFKNYLREQADRLDPIEGIWQTSDVMRSRIGIIKNDTKPGRDFIAFILRTGNPTWMPGDKKLDLARGERPGVYRGGYFLDDYRRESIAFALRGARTNTFVLQLNDDAFPIIFAKEEQP